MGRHTTQNFDSLQQKPVRHGLCRTLHKDFHWKCLLSTLLVHLCISYTIWCHLKFYAYAPENAAIYSYAHGPCAPGYNFIPIGFGVLLYLVYVTECWHFRSKFNAIPKRGVEEVKNLVHRMRTSTPIVWWKSVCYHYLRRTRQVTRYRNGDAISATQVYYERVNSHSSGNVFLYDCAGYRDISKELVNLDNYSVIRIKFTKGFVFACLQAANEFEEQRTRFFNENEVRDDYMEVREGLDLVDVPFTEHLLVYPQSSGLAAPAQPDDESELDSPLSPHHSTPRKTRLHEPWYMSSTAYWTASILLLSWPLRMLAEWKTAYLSYQVTKLFGTNYLSPSSVNYTGPLTRTSTMETCELELGNRQNYLIVPSYSEAILLDPLMMSGASNGVPGLGLPPPIPSIRNEFMSRNDHVTSSNEAAIIANYGSIGFSSGHTNTSFASSLSQKLFGARSRQYQLLNELHRPSRLFNLIEGVSYSRNNIHFAQEPTTRHTTTFASTKKMTKSRSMPFSFNAKNPVRRLNPPQSSAAIALPRPSKLPVTGTTSARDCNNGRKPPTRSVSISGAMSNQDSADFAWSNGQVVVPSSRNYAAERRPLLFGECSSKKPGADDPPPSYELALKMCAPLYNRLRQSANSISSLLNQAIITRSNSKDLRLQGDGPSSSSNNGYECLEKAETSQNSNIA